MRKASCTNAAKWGLSYTLDALSYLSESLTVILSTVWDIGSWHQMSPLGHFKITQINNETWSNCWQKDTLFTVLFFIECRRFEAYMQSIIYYILQHCFYYVKAMYNDGNLVVHIILKTGRLIVKMKLMNQLCNVDILFLTQVLCCVGVIWELFLINQFLWQAADSPQQMQCLQIATRIDPTVAVVQPTVEG